MRERVRVPAIFGENGSYIPKYSYNSGILKFENATYSDIPVQTNSTVVVDFVFESEIIRDSIVSESDVEVIKK